MKDTWGMANDRFLETQRVQKIEMDKIRKLLTIEQLKILGEDPNDSKEPVELLTPPSPATARRFLSRKGGNKKENVKARKSAESKRSLSSLVRSAKSNSLPPTPSLLDVSMICCDISDKSSADQVEDIDLTLVKTLT